ncbi:DNA sulfur modification protein DndB [Proteiniclasticum sp. BAD-10]|uniref:DNA sulfur modification protein DndB n=1 Tax=Proteiniclasticum sediminis TaxID=2804028 RepID=A0A941HQY0_9CLOT|nr:DNA sulfur modification protein DndB [Proteiniclasticum sediminis]MBR0576974.1 DNA sulfur modification protein DndB [Proteiniclasticum sediminis]
MHYFYSFPAIRGYQAKSAFFSIMCPLGLLSKLFTFYNNEIPEEYRAQRIVNEKRIPEIRDYVLNNPNDYVFSAITASMDGKYEFISSTENENIGILKVDMDCNLLINDGQHRKAAIDEAIVINPKLKDESISVVLFLDKGLVRSQQMFSDLNHHAVNVSSSLSILYNHRDPKIELTKKYLEHNTNLKQFIDMSSNSLAQKSNKLFILSIFHNSFMNTIGNAELFDGELVDFAFGYWDELCLDFNEWSSILKREVSPFHSRQSRISTYGVVLESLGLLGYSLYETNLNNWKKYVHRLNNINWDKSNRNDWLNRCIQSNGKITKSNRQVKLTYNRIKMLVGLSLSSSEIKLEQDFVKEK